MEAWKCKVCNLPMQGQQRKEHCSGKRHAAAVEKSKRLIQEAKAEKERQWKQAIAPPFQNLDARAARSQASFQEDKPSTSPSSMTGRAPQENSGVNGITDNPLSAASNITASPTTSTFSYLQCTTCDCYVPMFLKKSHLSSVSHIKKLVEVITVTRMAMSQSQLQEFENAFGRNQSMNYQAFENEPAVAFGEKHLPSFNDPISKSSATNSPLERETHANQRFQTETRVSNCTRCGQVLSNSDNKATHTCLPPQSTPPSATSPVDSFFTSFSVYQYNPSIPIAESFTAFIRGLKTWGDWDGTFPETWDEYKKKVIIRYQATLTREFNLWFDGTEENINKWHYLCRAIAIHPLPATSELCREAVSNKYVNVVDLIQWARERGAGPVRTFEELDQLSMYSYVENKIYKSNQAGQGPMLRHLLRRIKSLQPV